MIRSRLILELRDKLPPVQAGTAEPTPSPIRADLQSALANLGYTSTEAERAASEAVRLHPAATLGDLLREALRVISRR